ncbi:MAG: hypothetical protein KGR69_12270, partial [Verrucomicrobia bacterium]|nr:hypothetical protein [Verrucomicrobiota bacterium]
SNGRDAPVERHPGGASAFGRRSAIGGRPGGASLPVRPCRITPVADHLEGASGVECRPAHPAFV